MNPKTHPGFAGKLRPSKTEDSARPVGVSAQIPHRPFPYYTDAMTELAFVVPTLRPSAGDSSASLRSVESSDSSQDVSTSFSLQSQASAQPQPSPALTTQMSQPVHLSLSSQTPQNTNSGQNSPSGSTKNNSMYINIDALHNPKDSVGSGVSESVATAEGYSTYPGLSRAKKQGKVEPGSETPRKRWVVPQDGAAIVVWLEKFEDHLSFPTEVLSGLLHGTSFSGSHKITQSMKKFLPIIFIHMMSSGLYQIVTNNSGGRFKKNK